MGKAVWDDMVAQSIIYVMKRTTDSVLSCQENVAPTTDKNSPTRLQSTLSVAFKGYMALAISAEPLSRALFQ